MNNSLKKTVGNGKVRAEIKAEMDFDRISTVNEKYNPDGQVVRSTQSIEESNNSRDSEGTQPVTVGTNLPDPNSTGNTVSSTTDQNRAEETVNFEISKQIVNHVREAGIVKRLSVAVLIDGIRGFDEDSQPTYKPRSTTEMELLATLVRGAVGFNADRGDTVDVINMEFADWNEELEGPGPFFGIDKNDLLHMAEVLVLSIVAVLVILLVVRPLVSRAFDTISPVAAMGERLLSDQEALAGPGEMIEDEIEELIDIDRVEGRVRSSSAKQIGDFVDKYPEEALSIIRHWMHQGAPQKKPQGSN